MTKCPVCNAHLDIIATGKDNIITIDVMEHDREDKESRYNMLIDAFLSYCRWCTEGKPTPCYYHDNYHEHVNYHGDGVYSFGIQTYDSPDGDTWWNGTFKVEGHHTIVVTSEKYTRS